MAAPSFRSADAAGKVRLKVLRARVEPVLSNRLHVSFTDHSVKHSDRVAELAEKFASALPTGHKLNHDEAFVLYAACYLHDVGMHHGRAHEMGILGDRFGTAGRAELSWEEWLSELRENHARISADMVLADARGESDAPLRLALEEDDHPSEIAVLCQAHTQSTADPDYVAAVDGLHRAGMRMKLLSAFLRLADILDEARHRTPWTQFHTLPLDLEAQKHWWRHHYTKRVEFDTRRKTFTICYRFPAGSEAEYERIVPPLQTVWVEQELSAHRETLAESGGAWHMNTRVDQVPAGVAMERPMPPAVKSAMLRELADRAADRAERANLDRVRQFDAAAGPLVERMNALHDCREETDPAEYLRHVLATSGEAEALGATVAAREGLSSALFFAINNGRSVPPRLHCEAAVRVAKLWRTFGRSGFALRAIADVRRAAAELPADDEARREYQFLKIELLTEAGYDGDLRSAFADAAAVIRSEEDRTRLDALAVEAEVLFGADPQDSGDGANE